MPVTDVIIVLEFKNKLAGCDDFGADTLLLVFLFLEGCFAKHGELKPAKSKHNSMTSLRHVFT